MPSFTDLGVRSDVVTRLTARHYRAVPDPGGHDRRRARRPRRLRTRPHRLRQDHRLRHPAGHWCRRQSLAPPAARPRARARTRELANQVAAELQELAGPRARIATVYGGVGYGDQLRSLRRGVDILVACPGRLKDLVARNECRLDDVSFVVIDEADRMADMGFLPEVRRLLDLVRDDRQTLLFSATLDGDINTLIQRYQDNPVRHEVESDEDAPQNRHVFWKTDRNERVGLVANTVTAEWPAIVFCRTKHGADRLTEQLSKTRRVGRRYPRRQVAKPARARAERLHRAARCSASSPPTWPRVASTSTRSRASCTSIRPPTRRTTSTAPAALAAPAPPASWCRSSPPIR